MTCPTVMVVFLNFIMYIKMRRTHLESLSSRNNCRIFSVYVRLSTLTRVAWLSFIPVYFTNHTVLECIFFVLVTSQGVFIVLAFICNKRVFTTFKNKIHRKRPEINSSKYTSHNKDTFVFFFFFFFLFCLCVCFFFFFFFCFFFSKLITAL